MNSRLQGEPLRFSIQLHGARPHQRGFGNNGENSVRTRSWQNYDVEPNGPVRIYRRGGERVNVIEPATPKP